MYESFSIVLAQVLTLGVGTFALFNHWPLYWLILAYTIPSFVVATLAGFFLTKAYNIRYRFAFDLALLKSFVIMAVPFALAGLLGRLYSYTDSILMSKMLGSEHLGWWSVPYKITFAFQFIPAALSASIYPVMSSLMVTDKSKIAELYEKSWRYLLLIVFPLVFGLAAIAKPFILRFSGINFLPSVPVLQVLLISLVFSYLIFINGALLNAVGHQKTQVKLLAVALVLSIIFNILWLPVFGIMGAAISAVLSNGILFFLGYYYVIRIAGINSGPLFKFALQTFWPAAIMGLVVYVLVQRISFIIAVPIGALLYGSILWFTGILDVSMIGKVKDKIWLSRH